jgi:hypothetical protein
MLDIFDHHPVGVPIAHLAADRGALDRVEQFGSPGREGGGIVLEIGDLDGEPGRLERRPLGGIPAITSTDRCGEETEASFSPICG